MLFILIFSASFALLGLFLELVAFCFRLHRLAGQRRAARLRARFPLLYRAH